MPEVCIIGDNNTRTGLWLLEEAATLRRFSRQVLLHGYNCLLEMCGSEARADSNPATSPSDLIPASFIEVLVSLEWAGLTPDDHTNMAVTSWARLQCGAASSAYSGAACCI
jgi:hypothetical protein